jgi:hypothetical protein
MLTLAQMTQFVVAKVGQYDSVSQSLCRSYINARYKMVWDAYFWRDSQMTAAVALDDGSERSNFVYPDGMDRIVTIKLENDTFLDPVDETFLLETDPTILTRTGIPQFYSELRMTRINPPNVMFRCVKFYPILEDGASANFYIFGKRICPDLTSDGDTSALRNCDNVIIAYATGDMLERLRQYGKAQSKFQEAAALLQEAQNVEAAQANKVRRTKNLTVAGNSLLEMTDAVCAICNAWTPDIRILVKQFLRRNYVQLYDLSLWPESTVCVKVPFSGEQVIMPPFVDRVMSVRHPNGQTMLMPAEIQWVFGIDPTTFERTGGTPINFMTLTPCGVGVLPPAHPEKLMFMSTRPDDVGKKIFIRGESNGTEVYEEVVFGDPSTSPVLSAYAYDVPIIVGKEITNGDVTVNGASTSALLQYLPSGERERRHQRIWLQPNPGDDVQNVLVLGKRKILPLWTDEDTPIITGAQTVLIAGAAADLFTRLGNPNDAATQSNKAGVASKSLMQLNTDQNAFSPMIMPYIEPSAFGIGGNDAVWSKT